MWNTFCITLVGFQTDNVFNKSFGVAGTELKYTTVAEIDRDPSYGFDKWEMYYGPPTDVDYAPWDDDRWSWAWVQEDDIHIARVHYRCNQR